MKHIKHYGDRDGGKSGREIYRLHLNLLCVLFVFNAISSQGHVGVNLVGVSICAHSVVGLFFFRSTDGLQAV